MTFQKCSDFTFSLLQYFSVISLLLLNSLGNGCVDKEKKSSMPQLKNDIQTVLKAHTDSLMAISGVAGVYIGLKNDSIPCIRVMVVKKTVELEKKIPLSLQGFPLEIEETGVIEPMKDN
jgi:hypothetical protein